MHRPAKLASLPRIVAATLLAVACGDAVSPDRPAESSPAFSHTGESLGLDQNNGFTGTAPGGTTVVPKGFNPVNPHLGSAVVATFFWRGTTSVTTVNDRLADGTPLANTYTKVDSITAGGVTAVTFVATNVQGFPDPNPTPETALVVRANTSVPIVDGGVMLSAYTGVSPGLAEALGEHRSAAGSSDTHTIAAPGPIAVAAGALVYGVTLTDGRVGFAPPEGFTNLSTMSDLVLQTDAVYAVRDSAGSVDPQWTWFFEPPLLRTWLATVLALTGVSRIDSTIVLTGGDGGAAGVAADIHINVPSDSTARVQEVHRTLLHVICDLVERSLFETR